MRGLWVDECVFVEVVVQVVEVVEAGLELCGLGRIGVRWIVRNRDGEEEVKDEEEEVDGVVVVVGLFGETGIELRALG